MVGNRAYENETVLTQMILPRHLNRIQNVASIIVLYFNAFAIDTIDPAFATGTDSDT
jgi:hypothetical protein